MMFQRGVTYNLSVIHNFVMYIREQGFQQPEDDHLPPKQRKDQKATQVNPYFAIPDAKPILSKAYIDMNKPKVLIRQIPFRKQPIQIILGKHGRDFMLSDVDSVGNGGKKSNNSHYSDTTLWAKYVLSQNYQCVYLKFLKESLPQLLKRGHKKFKLQFQKICQYYQYVFSSYIIDLSFLTELGTYLMKNLIESSLEDITKKQIEEEVAFDSRFQCGNLYAVFQKNETNSVRSATYQFDLILQTDINTKGYSNWFYFSVRSKTRKKFRFNIVNMQKTHSMFTLGMKVGVFSQQKLKRDRVQWHRQGYDFVYTRNEMLKDKDSNAHYSTLSFSIDQKYDDDTIFIALNYPYSYSKLLRYLDSLEKIAKLNSHIYFKRQPLCKTISSNVCPVITLTWKRDKKSEEAKRRKKIIGVIARQHPCETVSSFVMEGFLNNLVYIKSEHCVELLKRFIFKIVPMVNIDGVIYGNSRCDINGNDVNRRWTRNPNTFLYPVVAAAKGLFNRLSVQGYQIQHFFDLHGHSKKMGSFVYGCRTYDQVESRQFAWIMSRLNPKFRFQDCSFGLSNFKKETARGTMSNLVVNKKSSTLETSFFGYKTSNGSKHFQVKDLHEIGETLLQALYIQQVRPLEGQINWDTIGSEIKNFMYDVARKVKEEEDFESSGSDSNPSVDQLNQKERAQTFLNAEAAAKIGLTQKIKVKSRTNSPMKLQRKKSAQIIQALRHIDQSEASNNLQSIFQQNQASEILPRHHASNNLMESSQKPLPFRESRSVTKITPFKFTDRARNRSSSDFKERIRIAIDICHMKPEQKLSTPNFPVLNPDGNGKFWKNLNKEYESLMIQKQNQILQMKGIRKYHF